jgi:hypothetical protein
MSVDTAGLESGRGEWNSWCSGGMRRYQEEHQRRRQLARTVLTLRRESVGSEQDEHILSSSAARPSLKPSYIGERPHGCPIERLPSIGRGAMGVTPREVQDRSELSQEQRDVLVGTILGDASLAKHGRFHRLHVKHKLAHESLAMLKYDAFREFISMAPHRFDQRLRDKRYPCVQFATRTNPVSRSGMAISTRAGQRWSRRTSPACSRLELWQFG